MSFAIEVTRPRGFFAKPEVAMKRKEANNHRTDYAEASGRTQVVAATTRSTLPHVTGTRFLHNKDTLLLFPVVVLY